MPGLFMTRAAAFSEPQAPARGPCYRQSAVVLNNPGTSFPRIAIMLALLAAVLGAPPVFAQPNHPVSTLAPAAGANPLGVPDLKRVFPPAADAQGVTASMAIFVLMTVLALAPAILVMMTSFTRIVIVLALLRQAIGTQQLPPSQIIMALALVLTAVVMAPTWQAVQHDALDPYLDGKLGQRAALDRAAAPLRAFMIRQIENARNEDDVYLFVEQSRGRPIPAGPGAPGLVWSEVRMWELVPAFVLSELKVSFIMGFRMYLPFLVIDMVISAILISMGMLMLPPVLISLPFKLLLFVVVDGWRLVVGSLMQSFA